ncbi:MAG: AMP-binding protein [Actinomycetaceae bacterium]|nr:AMP-binding protein [Actinomycetaceae bacterium]MDY6083600.1 AMP-binding protein [Actinomycetaceae bacterium]
MHDAMNFAQSLDHAAWMHPNRSSITYGVQHWTVGESAQTSRRIAQLLIQVGVARGDRVMMVAHNSPYHFLVYIACARLGAVFVPVFWRQSAAQLQEIVNFIAPRVLVADAEVAALGSMDSPGTLTHFVIDDDPLSGPLAPALANGYLSFTAAYTPFSGAFLADGDQIGSEDLNQVEYPTGLAALLVTSACENAAANMWKRTAAPDSGSAQQESSSVAQGSSAPGENSIGGSSSARRCDAGVHAIELTHANMWWTARNLRTDIEYSNMETALVASPMSQFMGFSSAALDVFASGGHIVLMRSFDAENTLDVLARTRVTLFFGIAEIWQALVESTQWSSADLSHLRYVLVGGTIADYPSPSLVAALGARGLNPITVWGVAELSASGTLLPWDRGFDHLESIGYPFMYNQVRIVDSAALPEDPALPESPSFSESPAVTGGLVSVGEDALSDVQPGEAGELVVRGPAVSRRYWHDEDLTARVYIGSWLRTGARVRVDANGFLWPVVP